MPLSTASTVDALLSSATSHPYFNVPRIVVIAANSTKVLYSGSSGYNALPTHSTDYKIHLDSAEKVTEDSIFDLFSCTKLVSVIAIMQLIEQGLVKMEDDASRWAKGLKDVKVLKGWTEGDAGEPILEANNTVITVEQLVNHTAGFTYSWDPSDSVGRYMTKLDINKPYNDGFSRDSLAKLPLINTPGENFQYGVSNDWLTVVVEEISGLSLEEYFQKNIFGPLEITDMTYKVNPLKMDMANCGESPSDPYTFTPGRACKPVHNFGGAGLSGSPKSYLRITQALLNGGQHPEGGRILKRETVDLMFEPHFKTATQRKDLERSQKDFTDPFSRAAEVAFPGMDWGYGGFLTGTDYPSGRQKGSLGWSGAANTFWVIDRASNLTFLVWTNVWPYGPQPVFDLWEKVEPELYKSINS